MKIIKSIVDSCLQECYDEHTENNRLRNEGAKVGKQKQYQIP